MAEDRNERPEAAEGIYGRREFMRRATLLAAGVAAAPLLAACDNAAPEPPPASPTSAPPPTSTAAPAVPTATPTSPVEASHTPMPTATEPPPATATQESTQVPTATSEPQPSATPSQESATRASGPHDVAIVAGSDRTLAVPAVLDLLGFAPGWLAGKHVALKANFNSADPAPAATHPDTLRALLKRLNEWGAARISILERSGMGDTSQVLRQLGVGELAKEFGAEVVVLDDLPAAEWEHVDGAHWRRGFLVPRILREAGAVVQTCCLKTHRFGGHFTMSLKNSVGLVAKFDPADGYNYMGELHSSPDQRQMIAEVNAAYKTALVLLDGALAFVTGGPDTGKLVEPGIFLASRDRVALDAAGVAMLRALGTTPEVSRGAIFGLQQIAGAVALGLGVAGPRAVGLHPAADEESRRLAGVLKQQLLA